MIVVREINVKMKTWGVFHFLIMSIAIEFCLQCMCLIESSHGAHQNIQITTVVVSDCKFFFYLKIFCIEWKQTFCRKVCI